MESFKTLAEVTDMRVQARLAKYIRENGIKQTHISQLTGISDGKLSMILNLKRVLTADELERICIAIKKSPNNFVRCRKTIKGGADEKSQANL